MVMIVHDSRSQENIEIVVMQACILGYSFTRIARKTGMSERTLKNSLARMIKAKIVSQDRKNQYYLVTEKGERLLADFDRK